MIIFLFYAKSNESKFNKLYIPLTEEEIDKKYKHYDPKWKNTIGIINLREKSSIIMEKGKRYSILLARYSYYCASATNSKERVGYPTQKPLALYDRIILTGSDESWRYCI